MKYTDKHFIGKKFGMLTVCSIDVVSGCTTFVCSCDCGGSKRMSASNVVLGKSRSCGCLVSSANASRNHKHGFSTRERREKLFRKWCSIMERCYGNTNAKTERCYRDKGITVCDEWKDYAPFREWALHSGYADGLTIDRIDSSLGYSPGNCRWLTLSENGRLGAVSRWESHKSLGL